MNDIKKVVEDLKQLKHCLTNKCDETCTYYTDLFDDCNCNYDVSSDVTIDNAINTIRELQEQIPKWHLVADELPEVGDTVLVVDNINEKRYIGTGVLKANGNWYISLQTQDYKDGIVNEESDVIAWMELPKFEEKKQWQR